MRSFADVDPLRCAPGPPPAHALAPRRLPPLARPGRRLSRRADGGARRHHRQRRLAVDPRRPRLFRDDAGLGRQRLPAHLRRLPAARRPARRSVRSPPCLHHRHRPLHRRLARLRHLERAAAAGRGARDPGHRRRDRRRGRAGAADDALHRSRRARQGDGRVRLRLRRRRLDRRPARRRPHRRLRLALGLPRQPADRRRRGRAQRRLAARRGDAPRAGAPRRRRRRHRDRGADARRLRDRRRQRSRLGIAANARRSAPARRCCSRCSSSSRRASPSR